MGAAPRPLERAVVHRGSRGPRRPRGAGRHHPQGLERRMEFTKQFLRAKSPCANGFRWFVRHIEDGVGYQQALDQLVAAGRVDDALWLLGQFGPTNAVLSVDSLEAEAVVFAGTVQVRGGIEVDGVIHAGRSIHAGGGIRAGGTIVAGEDIRAGASIRGQGRLHCGGDLRTDWGVEVQESLHCGGDLRAAWDVVCGGALTVGAGAFIGRDLTVHGGIACDKSLRAGGDIRAGEGYGIFAGLNVQEPAWEDSAQVWSQRLPAGLRSGMWMG